jgi:NAD(P)H-flavin reductase
MVPVPFRITKVIREIPGVYTWHLKSLDGNPFVFLPGQFNMVYQFGVGEIPVSISGDRRQPDTLVHTIRAVGPVTNAMQQLKVGAIVGIRGPFGRPWPIDEVVGSDILFVTSTIGLAPLRGLIYEVLHRRQDFGKVSICYGTRAARARAALTTSCMRTTCTAGGRVLIRMSISRSIPPPAAIGGGLAVSPRRSVRRGWIGRRPRRSCAGRRR